MARKMTARKVKSEKKKKYIGSENLFPDLEKQTKHAENQYNKSM